MVLHHGYISDIAAQVYAKPENEAKIWQLFVDTVGDVWYDLLVFILADLRGTDLKKFDPERFAAFEAFYVRRLEEMNPIE